MERFNEFIDNCKARNLRRATINHYKESYTYITRFIDKDRLIGEIDINVVDKFMRDYNDKLQIKTQTLYTYSRDLKTILYYFMQMNYPKHFKIKLSSVDREAVIPYSDTELTILLK